MFRSRFVLTAVVAVATALTAPAVSQAAFVVTFKIDGSTVATFNPTNAQVNNLVAYVASGTYTVGGDTIGINAQISGNIPGDWMGVLEDSTISASRISGTGTHKVSVTVTSTTVGSDSGVYTSPGPGTLYLWSDLTVIKGFLPSQIDGTNFSFTSTATGTGVGGTSTTTGEPLQLDTTTGDWVSGTKSFSTGTGSGAGYTLGQTATFTIGSGNNTTNPISFQLTSSVIAPAPAGLVMFASALPFAGLLRLRRRFTKAEVATAA
jgi:hypothetical protein